MKKREKRKRKMLGIIRNFIKKKKKKYICCICDKICDDTWEEKGEGYCNECAITILVVIKRYRQMLIKERKRVRFCD
jgi:hypothetical protein